MIVTDQIPLTDYWVTALRINDEIVDITFFASIVNSFVVVSLTFTTLDFCCFNSDVE